MKIIRVLKSPKKYMPVILERVKNIWRVWFHSGNKVSCKICNWKGKSFFSGKCPKCGSLPRTRLISYAIDYFELSKPDLKILHVAPNRNEYDIVVRMFDPINKYDRLNLNLDSEKVANLIKDLTNTGLEDNSYDFQIIWHVLEHIPEDKKAIAELYRLLKPGGNLLVSVPIYPQGNKETYEDEKIPYKDYEEIHGDFDHCRSCGLDYYKRFEKLGFTTKKLEIKNLNKKDIEKFGLRRDHVVWCFKK